MNNSPFPDGSLIALYLRDSGGDEQELSIDQQRRALTEWAAAQGLRLGKEFADSVSGTSTQGRENFLRMMRYFQHDPPEAGILVWRSNRFGRNLDDSQFFKIDLRRRGYIVHSLVDNVPEGPMGKFIEFALDWKDELFSQQLSEDVKRGLMDLVRIYGAVPGTPPRGFTRSPITIGARRNGEPHTVHRWIPDPDLAPIIRQAFEMRARGATLKQIQAATRLYKTTNCWVSFFGNPLYKGDLQFGGQTFTGYCEPIVDPDLWQSANLTGQRRRHIPKQRGQARRLASSYLLSGLVRCQRCGALMSGKNVLERKYYACSRRLKSGTCDARQIPAETFEQAVIENLLDHILALENLLNIQARLQEQYTAGIAEISETAAATRQTLTDTRRRITNITQAIADQPSKHLLTTLHELETRETELTIQLQTLTERLAPPPSLSGATLQQIANEITTILRDGTIETKRYYLTSFIQHITATREPDTLRAVVVYTPPYLCKETVIPWGHSYVSISAFEFLVPLKAHKEPKRPA